MKRFLEHAVITTPLVVAIAFPMATWVDARGTAVERGRTWIVREHVEASATRVGLALAAVARDAGDLATVERVRRRHHLETLIPGTQLRVVSTSTFSKFLEVRIESGPSAGRLVFVDSSEPALASTNAR